MLFHDKYRAYPEIWRQAPGGEGRAVLWSILPGLSRARIRRRHGSRRGHLTPRPLAPDPWPLLPCPVKGKP